MSILFRRAPQQEVRSISWQTAEAWAASVNGDESASMAGALRLAPIYSAVDLIASSLVTLPLHVYRDSGGARVRVSTDPQVIADPNPRVDPLAWRCQYVASMLLRGNAYGYLTDLDSAARPQRIVWLNPDAVSVDQSKMEPVYRVSGKEVDASLILHIPAMTLPGTIVGLAPLTLFRTQIRAGADALEMMGSFYRNGGPSAHFKNVQKVMDADTANAAKRRFKASMDAGDLLVTGSDWEYKQLGVSAADAQFVENAKLTANQIASIYHVPADEIGGETGSSLTYATLEMNEQKFTTRALMPWTVRLERALTDLLPRPQYVKFNLDSYVRADLKTRMESHEIALRTGLETQGEGRALEDRPPLTEAEVAFWAEYYAKQSATPAATTGGGNGAG